MPIAYGPSEPEPPPPPSPAPSRRPPPAPVAARRSCGPQDERSDTTFDEHVRKMYPASDPLAHSLAQIKDLAQFVEKCRQYDYPIHRFKIRLRPSANVAPPHVSCEVPPGPAPLPLTRPVPTGFLNLRPPAKPNLVWPTGASCKSLYPPETGYHMLGVGGGSKVCAQKDLNQGRELTSR